MILGSLRTSGVVLSEVIPMSTATSATCPECEAAVPLKGDVEKGEIVPCPDCGAELEVIEQDPITLRLAPAEEEDWGE